MPFNAQRHELTLFPDAGYRAIFVSVDVPVLGRRLNEMRNNFTLPEHLGFPNILSTGGEEFGSVDAKESGPKAFGRQPSPASGMDKLTLYQMTLSNGRRLCLG